MFPAHPLDRPAWTALNTRQASLAKGGSRAVKFAPDFAPFAGAADMSDESIAALAQLASPGEGLWVVEPDAFAPPPGMVATTVAPCEQMIATQLKPAVVSADIEIVDLTEADVSQMRALAALTKPGPFAARTHQLGPFVGVKRGRELVAMAGERMKPADFTEVSGVCTHPDHRGAGYGGILTATVAARIQARGETPFLHVFAENAGAVRLYESLGFSIRRTIILTVLDLEPGLDQPRAMKS